MLANTLIKEGAMVVEVFDTLVTRLAMLPILVIVEALAATLTTVQCEPRLV